MENYKKTLVLHYFHNVGASYSYQELLMLFGFQNEQLDALLSELLNEELLVLDKYLKVTPKALEHLEELNLIDVEFNETEEELFTEDTINFDDVYIPKRFDGKFK